MLSEQGVFKTRNDETWLRLATVLLSWRWLALNDCTWLTVSHIFDFAISCFNHTHFKNSNFRRNSPTQKAKKETNFPKFATKKHHYRMQYHKNCFLGILPRDCLGAWWINITNKQANQLTSNRSIILVICEYMSTLCPCILSFLSSPSSTVNLPLSVISELRSGK